MYELVYGDLTFHICEKSDKINNVLYKSEQMLDFSDETAFHPITIKPYRDDNEEFAGLEFTINFTRNQSIIAQFRGEDENSVAATASTMIKMVESPAVFYKKMHNVISKPMRDRYRLLLSEYGLVLSRDLEHPQREKHMSALRITASMGSTEHTDLLTADKQDGELIELLDKYTSDEHYRTLALDFLELCYGIINREKLTNEWLDAFRLGEVMENMLPEPNVTVDAYTAGIITREQTGLNENVLDQIDKAENNGG